MDPANPELDARFSEPGATAVPWSDARCALESAEMSWLTTVRADGRPHVTPLVAVWLDDAVHFSTGPDEQKARNLAANPHVVVTTGTHEWNRGLDVVVEGEAVRVTDRPTLERLARAWSEKWDGRWTYTAVDGGFAHDGGDHGPVHVYAVRPTKVFAFGKAPFSQTRYR
jgi:general stress protein 26